MMGSRGWNRSLSFLRTNAMSDGSHVDDPAYWRKRAKEVRALADHVAASANRNDILRIAEDYDRLVERAEKRVRDRRSGTTSNSN
jgi:hypothetical protein